MNGDAVVEFKLPAFHSSLADRHQKIILSATTLGTIVTAAVQFPLTFQIGAAGSVSLTAPVGLRSARGGGHGGTVDGSMDTSEDDDMAFLTPGDWSSSNAALPSRAPNAGTLGGDSKVLAPSHPASFASSDSKRDGSDANSSSVSDEAPAPPTLFPVMPGTPRSRYAYVGVHDFSASADMVLLPRSLMYSLSVNDGDLVHLKTVNLVKCKSVKLQPLTSSWTYINEEERKALLESELRKHQFLAQGSRIALQVQSDCLSIVSLCARFMMSI